MQRGKAASTGLTLVLLSFFALTTAAHAEIEPGGEGDLEGIEAEGEASPLEQAREESGVAAPPSSFGVPGGSVDITSSLLAAAGGTFRLSLELDRPVAAGSFDVRLPARWVGDAAPSGLPFADVPRSGRAPGSGIDVARAGRVVSFSFDGARAGERASFELDDVGIPAGTYELPYAWREPGATDGDGTADVTFFAPTREEGAPNPLADPTARIEYNATNDGVTESETFLTAVPGDPSRFIVGANGGGGFNAWITNDGGAGFTKATMPSAIDAPGEVPPEDGALCCDPMSAADAAGNVWYGGLSFDNGVGNPSRIVVNRIAPGATTFQPRTVGLPVRTSDADDPTQDKPMMTIDNSPASRTFGRLYVVWDEPSSAGINIVLSACDTRSGSVSNPAACDDADNWSTPVNVTPATGSYIYADVAVGPSGKVYVVWWNYSSANAIQGDVCDPATQNCKSAAGWSNAPAPKTIATLDRTNNAPVPFACPILAQPGGRAAPSPQVDVDRSGGPNDGRVYVSWGDLRTGSGSTRCAAAPGGGTPPSPTHLSWDGFVASAPNALPGSANRSSIVATRLLADGEGGGQSNSDDWFPWLAIDQSTGRVWADFYSTRDDATRRTTNFYVRSVRPNAATGGHDLSALNRVSSAPSDYSTNPCCIFGNDYGDYTGIDASGGFVIPVWSDKRGGADGEAYVSVLDGATIPEPTPATPPAEPATPQPSAADTKRPQTKITKRPKRRSARRRPRIKFGSSEQGSSFECRLDGKRLPGRKCRSPLKLRVKRGRHVFEVTATDSAGNRDRSPAVTRWKVRRKRRR